MCKCTLPNHIAVVQIQIDTNANKNFKLGKTEAQKHVDPVDLDPDPQHWLLDRIC
jgi:hypothetical protein